MQRGDRRAVPGRMGWRCWRSRSLCANRIGTELCLPFPRGMGLRHPDRRVAASASSALRHRLPPGCALGGPGLPGGQRDPRQHTRQHLRYRLRRKNPSRGRCCWSHLLVDRPASPIGIDEVPVKPSTEVHAFRHIDTTVCIDRVHTLPCRARCTMGIAWSVHSKCSSPALCSDHSCGSVNSRLPSA